jgi:hypothetical protein
LHEDLKLRQALLDMPDTKGADIADVEIIRHPQRITMVIHTARPGVIIGVKGGTIEKIGADLQKMASKKIQLKITSVVCVPTSAVLPSTFFCWWYRYLALTRCASFLSNSVWYLGGRPLFFPGWGWGCGVVVGRLISVRENFDVFFPPKMQRGYTITDFFAEVRGKRKGWKSLCQGLSRCLGRVAGEDTFVLQKRDRTELLDFKSVTALLDSVTVAVTDGTGSKDHPVSKILKTSLWQEFVQEFDRVRFFSESEREVSLWPGWPVNPQRNDSLLAPFLSHVREIICAGIEENFEVVLDWCAFAVQNLNSHNRFALVLLGEEGAGKNTFTDAICSLFGSQFSKSNVNDLS